MKKTVIIRGLNKATVDKYDREVNKQGLKGVRTSREALMREQLINRYESKS